MSLCTWSLCRVIVVWCLYKFFEKITVLKRAKFQYFENPVARWPQTWLYFDCGIQWHDTLELPSRYQDFMFSQHDLLSRRHSGLLHRDLYMVIHGARGKTTLYDYMFNTLRPSDAIWRHRSGSTLAQAMACCLTAPKHYLNQCWLISKV